jgi:hypothetical protein
VRQLITTDQGLIQKAVFTKAVTTIGVSLFLIPVAGAIVSGKQQPAKLSCLAVKNATCQRVEIGFILKTVP